MHKCSGWLIDCRWLDSLSDTSLIFVCSRDGNPEQEVGEPEPEDDEQPRESGEGLQQEEMAHPFSAGTPSSPTTVFSNIWHFIDLSQFDWHILILICFDFDLF